MWPLANTVYKKITSEQRMITTQDGNKEMRGAWAKQSHVENKEEQRPLGRVRKEKEKKI